MAKLLGFRGIVLLGICLGWGALFGDAIAQPRFTRPAAEQAQQAYDAGQYRQAFQQWQTVLDRDDVTADQRLEIQVNQGLALQQLGQSQQACLRFAAIAQLSAQVCQSDAKDDLVEEIDASIQSPPHFFSALFLSQVLWTLGNLDDASAVAEQVLAKSTSFEGGRYRAIAQLEYNDLQHRRCKQKLEQNFLLDDIVIQSQQLNQILSSCQPVFQTYQSLFEHEETQMQSQLHWVEFYLTLQQWDSRTDHRQPALQAMVQQKQAEALDVWEGASSTLQSLGSDAPIDLELQLIRQGLELRPTQNRTLEAFERLRTVLDRTQTMKRPQAIAYRLIGDLYQNSQQWAQAETAYRQALTLAAQSEQWDLIAQLHQALARVNLQTGQPEAAIQSYENAIESLEVLGPNGRSIASALNFSFQEQVETLHHDYMKVLLQQPKPDYGKVIAVHDQLRVKELVNYLRCGALEVDSLANLAPSETSTHFIHILQLDQAFHVLVQLSSGEYYHYQPNRQTVEQNLNRLLLNLKSDTLAFSSERSIQRAAKALYDELLGPIASQFNRDSTLVFSLDSRLHRLPMALLYDGQKYLFETFQLSTNFGLRVSTIKDSSPPLENVLIAGLSTVSPSFQQLSAEQRPPLVNVTQEAQAIAGFADRSDLLLNQTFTLEQLQQRLYRQDYPLLHIATHGSFSSDPDETYLLAWDQKIRLPDFERLLQTLSQQGQSLALLVLSACETAQGDRRAALGLAGLATQSGAQTTVASLWKVDDQATAQFMTVFYRALADGEPKAKALRQAQIELRQSDIYRSPYYWAPFILLGDWR